MGASWQIIMIVLIVVLTFTLSGRYNERVSNTKMKLDFDSKDPTDSYKEQNIYISEDIDKIELDGKVKIDYGEVNINIVDITNNEVIWGKEYNENSDIKIELTNLKAEREYKIQIWSKQAKKVKVSISSKENLIGVFTKS